MDAGTAAFARRGAWTDAGFALALGVLVVIAAMTVWSFEQHAAAARAVAQTERVRTTLGDARWALADLRARELTSFLQPGAYRQPDVAVLRSRLAAVRDLTVDNAEQQARLADVDRALTALVGLLRDRAYAPGALSSQDERVATAAETDRQLRGLNEQMAQLDTAERRLLEARTQASEARLQWLGWAIATLVAVLVMLLALLYAYVRRWQKQEDGLLRAEQRFQLMAQNVAEYAILMLDPSGNVLSWNVGAERLEGWSAEEILGSHVSRFYPPEDAADGKPRRALECAATTGRFEEEGWRMRKDGSRFWAFVVITALRDQGGAIAGFLKITRDLTDRRRAEEALRAEVAETHRVERQLHEANLSLESQVAGRTAQLTAANADLEEARGRLQELSAHLIASQEEERRRISRELHDETGQSLTGIKLRLSAGLRDGSLGVKGIEECIAHVDATIRQIRQLSLDLRPLVLDDLGLADALEGTLQQMGERAGWDTRLALRAVA
jgi:PAS domain S-box-containing protein